MHDLEARLEEAGRAFAFTPTPSVVERTLPHFQKPRPWARLLAAAALAAAAFAGGTLVLSPAARSEVRSWVGVLPGVDVERVETLPPFPADAAPPYLGDEISLSVAQAVVPWNLRVPLLADLGEPTQVFYRYDGPGGIVTLIYGSEPRARLTQWRGSISSASFELESGASRVETVSVRGRDAVWLEGHVQATYTFVGAEGTLHHEALPVTGNVLLWQEGEIAFRLETAASKADAIAVADAVARR